MLAEAQAQAARTATATSDAHFGAAAFNVADSNEVLAITRLRKELWMPNQRAARAVEVGDGLLSTDATSVLGCVAGYDVGAGASDLVLALLDRGVADQPADSGQLSIAFASGAGEEVLEALIERGGTDDYPTAVFAAAMIEQATAAREYRSGTGPGSTRYRARIRTPSRCLASSPTSDGVSSRGAGVLV